MPTVAQSVVFVERQITSTPFKKSLVLAARLIGLFVARPVTHGDLGRKKSGWRFRFGIKGRQLQTNNNNDGICSALHSPSTSPSAIVLVVGWGSKLLRKDGRTDEGRKQAAKSKIRMQAAGVSRVYHQETAEDEGRRRFGQQATIGVYPGKCFFGPWGHRKAP
jgi:hypothetical protein